MAAIIPKGKIDFPDFEKQALVFIVLSIVVPLASSTSSQDSDSEHMRPTDKAINARGKSERLNFEFNFMFSKSRPRARNVRELRRSLLFKAALGNKITDASHSPVHWF